MKLYTISAYQITAREFFTRLTEWHADLLLDVRLKNQSQLAGFTRKDSLEYFVPRLCGARYVHDTRFAPDPEKLAGYLNKRISWAAYADDYRAKITDAHGVSVFFSDYGTYENVCLLGTATKQRRSHTEVLEELITASPQFSSPRRT